MQVACVGGGPAGLYFAILMKLRDRGHGVTVYERNPAGVTYGWGVVLWEGTLARLEAGDPELARMVRQRSVRWAGQVLHVSGREPVRRVGEAFCIGRRELLDLLARRALALGVDVRFEQEVLDPAELASAELVVAADGAGSRVRRQGDRFGTEVATGRNRYLWLGTTKVFDCFTFGFAETEAGWIWIHAYAFDADTSTVVVETTPETWAGLGLEHLGAAESLALLEHIFSEQLEGHPLLASGGAEEILPWVRFRTLTNRTWHDGRTVLVGDAAHTTHFSIGSGTSLALEDATVLAETVDQNPDLARALEAYDTRRRAEIAGAQAQARLSARFFEDIGRYAGLAAPDLMLVLLARHSPLVHRLPPAAYCTLQRAAGEVPLLRWARGLVGRTANALLTR